MTIKDKIKEVLKDTDTSKAIALLESISKELRRQNSVRINNAQMGRMEVDTDRPDLIAMK